MGGELHTTENGRWIVGSMIGDSGELHVFARYAKRSDAVRHLNEIIRFDPENRRVFDAKDFYVRLFSKARVAEGAVK